MTGPELNVRYTDASAWARGPQRVYHRLATRAVGVFDEALDDALVLDVGAGTGAMTHALQARGARPIAADLSTDMLGELRRQQSGAPALACDVGSIGCREAVFDAAVAGFVINHLAEPAVALREMARVTRRGGRVLATTFGADDHPVKDAINAVLQEHGWTPPQWYLDIKERYHPLTATSDACRHVLIDAGLRDTMVTEVDVDLSDLSPAEVAGYRLGMAQSAGFVAGLPPAERETITAEATRAAMGLPPLRLPMLVLQGTR